MKYIILLLLSSPIAAQPSAVLPVDDYKKDGSIQAIQQALDQKFAVTGGTITGSVFISSPLYVNGNLITPSSSGSDNALLSATQTFSGANTFVSSVVVQSGGRNIVFSTSTTASIFSLKITTGNLINIPGGVNGYVLTSDADGNASWTQGRDPILIGINLKQDGAIGAQQWAPAASNATKYLYINAPATMFVPGIAGVFSNATEQSAHIPAVVAGTLKNLACALDSVAGTNPSGSMVLTVRKNAADTTLTCTITSASSTCADITHTVTVVAGDRLALKMVEGNASGTAVPNGSCFFHLAF